MRQTEPLAGIVCIMEVGAGVWMFQNISRRSISLCPRVKVGLDDGDCYR